MGKPKINLKEYVLGNQSEIQDIFNERHNLEYRQCFYHNRLFGKFIIKIQKQYANEKAKTKDTREVCDTQVEVYLAKKINNQ